jgi:hypothetical protein
MDTVYMLSFGYDTANLIREFATDEQGLLNLASKEVQLLTEVEEVWFVASEGVNRNIVVVDCKGAHYNFSIHTIPRVE